MKLLQLYDVLFEAKEDKLAQTFGKKILAAIEASPNMPPQIATRLAQGGEEMIPLNVVKFLAQYDATPQRKYLQWMVLQFTRGLLLLEDAYKLPEIIQRFEQYGAKLPKKSIDQYKSYRDLDKALIEFEREQTASGTAERSTGLRTFLARPDVQSHMGGTNSKIVYQSPRLLIVQPLNRQASCQLGKGTKWCVAATTSQNYFDHYTSQGPLYFMYTDKGRKYGIHFETNNFMDEQDHPVNILDIIEDNPEMLKAFNPDQIAMAAAKGWNSGTYRNEDQPSFNGAEMFMELWKRHGFVAGPKGQAHLTGESPVFALDLARAGYPLAPEAHAAAIEAGAGNSGTEALKELYQYYQDLAEHGELPEEIRVALAFNEGIGDFGTPEEKAQYDEMITTDIYERTGKFGTIEEVYQQTGLTPVLMERLRQVEDYHRNYYEPWYSTTHGAMVIDEYDDFGEVTDDFEFGDDAKFAHELRTGHNNVEHYDAIPSAYGDVWEALTPEFVHKEIWEGYMMNEDKYRASTYDALMEWADYRDFDYPRDDEGDVDYAKIIKDNTDENGIIDKNFVGNLLEEAVLEELNNKLQHAADIAWMTASEQAEESEWYSQFNQWMSNGMEAELAGQPISVSPRKRKEFADSESPFVVLMPVDNYVQIMSVTEEDGGYPDYRYDLSDVDKFNYHGYGAYPDAGSLAQQFNEYLYMIDE